MKRVALIGMPNTGKSTLFNRMTGASARTGNWPGVTVDLASSRILLGAHMVQVVDLPGIYDLNGYTEDEEVVRRFLANNDVDLVLLIVNTSQIERQLALALQVKALGLPAMVLLNMADEAKKFGVTVNPEGLSAALGLPVVMLSAKYGAGYQQALSRMTDVLGGGQASKKVDFTGLQLPGVGLDLQVKTVLAGNVDMPAQLSDHLTQRLDHLLLHPVLGLPIFFGVMYLMFQAVFILGNPLQNGVAWVIGEIRDLALAPVLSHLPTGLSGLLLDGVWGGLGTVAAFVPVIILFFLFMAIIEDTGYLSRAAFLMDAFMARMGLDGRSFVMILMGFGCNVPALMGTRIMRSRALRLLTMLVIPFSLCSARLQVFVFLTAALFDPIHAGRVLFSLYMFSFFTVLLTAFLFRGKFVNSEPFVLELPPYRFPTLRQMILRGWLEVRHFLMRASKFIIAGCVFVWLLTHVPFDVPPASDATVAGHIGQWLNGIFAPLGISPKMTLALIFGFVAKEVVIGSLAVIFGLQGHALMHEMAQRMDWVQAYSFMLFTLIYTPCLSTIATIRSESKSRAFTAFSLAWPLALAWVLTFAFYQGARALGY